MSFVCDTKPENVRMRMLANLSLADDLRSLRIQIDLAKQSFKEAHAVVLMKKKDGPRFKQVINKHYKGSKSVFARKMFKSKL